MVCKHVFVVRITEGAGVSSTGDPDLDRALPFRERVHIDEDAARTIDAARLRGNRVVAIGTSVVRALESAARLTSSGRLASGEFETALRVDASLERRVVSAVLTGVHEPETSHFALLQAFASRALLEEANRVANDADYLLHEFGDSVFVNAASPCELRTRPPLPTRSRSRDERDRAAGLTARNPQVRA